MLKMVHQHKLTEREMEILYLLMEGLGNKQIAEKLRITIRTVKFHTSNLYTKLGVSSRLEAMAWAWKHHEIQISPEES